jgi:hypothetical protein
MDSIAAVVYCILAGAVVVFQLALSFGAPWGEMTIGGKYPGRLPPFMRIGTAVQAGVLVFIGLIVLARAGLLLPGWQRFSHTAIWFVVVFSAVAVILNSITPSKKERLAWAPTTALMLVASLIVAL